MLKRGVFCYNKHMHIKIKDPLLTQHHFTMLIWGILAGLALAAAAAAVYFAGGPLRAWHAMGDTINTFCGDDPLCTLSFTALFKLAPLACIGFFGFSLWEKRTNFRSPRTGAYFTYMTFGPDGVLLENPNPTQNVFFPYEQTSLRVTVHARLYHVKRTPRIHIWNIEFTFTRQDGTRQTIQLVPPYRVLPFLCKILDKRTRFYEFSYDASPRSDQQAALSVLKKMDGYCQTGFMSVFDSKDHRTTFFWVGIVLAFGAVWTFLSFKLEDFFQGGFFILVPLAAWFLGRPLKDIYRERRSRKK